MVVDQSTRSVYGHQAGFGRKPFGQRRRRNDGPMGNGQNPAPVVSIGFVEHFELVRRNAVDAAFDTQRPLHRIRQGAHVSKKRCPELPIPSCWLPDGSTISPRSGSGVSSG